MTMTQLNQSELECLRKIANGQSSNVMSVCASDILANLVSRGLIEYGPAMRLPLEMAIPCYKVTSSGYAVLRRSNPD